MSDLERSLRFWGDALGMRVVARHERRGGYFEAIVREPDAHVLQALLEFPGAGARIELFQYLAPAGAVVCARPRDVGFAHVAVACDDLDALIGPLVAAGGEVFGPVVVVDEGVSAGQRAVYIRDPDGHVLELSSSGG